MFVGHYGPAAALTGSRVKLWHGVVAVQLLDILWAPLVLAGVEKLRIVENYTASNHLDLYHMPWTHSLPMAVFWSAAAGGAYFLLRRRAGLAGAAIIAALVFSHWLLDLATHKPDLELWFGGPKAGLGLWENRPFSFSIESGLFVAGMAIYVFRTTAKNIQGSIALAAFLSIGLVLQIFGNWGPPPPSPQAAAATAIFAYVLFALLALWCDAKRDVKP